MRFCIVRYSQAYSEPFFVRFTTPCCCQSHSEAFLTYPVPFCHFHTQFEAFSALSMAIWTENIFFEAGEPSVQTLKSVSGSKACRRTPQKPFSPILNDFARFFKKELQKEFHKPPSNEFPPHSAAKNRIARPYDQLVHWCASKNIKITLRYALKAKQSQIPHKNLKFPAAMAIKL